MSKINGESKKGKRKYRKRYSGKLRCEIDEKIENGDMTFSEAIREYDLNDSTLCRWLRIYRSEGKSGLLESKKGGKKPDVLYKKRGQENLEKKKFLTQQEEIRLLRMQNQYYEKVIALLTEENEKKKNQAINKKPK